MQIRLDQETQAEQVEVENLRIFKVGVDLAKSDFKISCRLTTQSLSRVIMEVD